MHFHIKYIEISVKEWTHLQPIQTQPTISPEMGIPSLVKITLLQMSQVMKAVAQVMKAVA